jgi:hypothetical protein
MATSNDHPGLPFVQAKGYASGRPDGPPLWIVVHDMEASEYSGRAESTAVYFADPPDGRQVSSHYVVDNDSVIQCVDLDDVAWTVGNRPGNNRGINWELAGFARQTRAEWLDPFGVAMFARMAPIAAADMHRFNIPNRWCTIADLQARRPGLTTHNDLRIAFGVTTHTDPGPNFPRDYLQQVLAAALNPSEEDDMDPQVEHDLIWTTNGIAKGDNPIVIPTRTGGLPERRIPNAIRAELDAVKAALSEPVPVEVDAATLAEAFTLALQDPATLAALAKAVNDDAAARLAQ